MITKSVSHAPAETNVSNHGRPSARASMSPRKPRKTSRKGRAMNMNAMPASTLPRLAARCAVIVLVAVPGPGSAAVSEPAV